MNHYFWLGVDAVPKFTCTFGKFSGPIEWASYITASSITVYRYVRRESDTHR